MSRTPTGNPPGRPKGCAKVGGRKRGSLDRSERLLITEKIAGDILRVYKRLGPDWLYNIAKERPDLFLNQCLSRLLPAPIKEDSDAQFNQQINIGSMSDFEAGRHIAFALAKALDLQPAPIEAERLTPQMACQVTPPEDYPAPVEPTDADRERWASELKLSEAERRDRALVRQDHVNLAEQGLRRRQLL